MIDNPISDFVLMLGKQSLMLQAACVFEIAKDVFPIWRSGSDDRHAIDASERLYDALQWTIAHSELHKLLPAFMEEFRPHLEQDLTDENTDRRVGMAEWVIFDVGLILLDLCEDVHFDILATAIHYGARVITGSNSVPVTVLSLFSPEEEAYLRRWIAECRLGM